MDFEFRRVLTPQLVRFAYVFASIVGVIGVIIGGIMFLGAFQGGFGAALIGAGGLVLAASSVFQVVGVRVLCEVAMVYFRTAAHVARIRDQTQNLAPIPARAAARATPSAPQGNVGDDPGPQVLTPRVESAFWGAETGR